MAEVKWIKLSTNMFEDEKIKLIRKMPEGNNMLIVWIYLLVLAGKCNAGGYIFLAEDIPYTDEMLSTVVDMPLNTVRLALKTFGQLRMIELDEDNRIYIANWEKHQNIEGLERIREQNRLRQQRYRERQKALKEKEKDDNKDSNVGVTLHNAPEEEEEEDRDIDREEDKEIEEEEEDKKESSAASALYDKDFKLIIKTYNENIRPITPIEAEKLEKWLEDGMEGEVIISAIEESVTYNKRSLGYIEAILRNWHGNNIKTKADLDAYMRDRADKKNKTGNRKHQGLNKQTDFNKFEHHEYSEDDLESLFVDIGAG